MIKIFGSPCQRGEGLNDEVPVDYDVNDIHDIEGLECTNSDEAFRTYRSIFNSGNIDNTVEIGITEDYVFFICLETYKNGTDIVNKKYYYSKEDPSPVIKKTHSLLQKKPFNLNEKKITEIEKKIQYIYDQKEKVKKSKDSSLKYPDLEEEDIVVSL